MSGKSPDISMSDFLGRHEIEVGFFNPTSPHFFVNFVSDVGKFQCFLEMSGFFSRLCRVFYV